MSLTVAELRYLFTANTTSLDRGFAKAQAGVTATEAAGRRMAATGTTMTKGLTLPMIAAGVAAGKMASDYESSMQKIVGLVGISQKQVDAWSTQILNLAKGLPQSPKELADAMFFVTSAGFRGKEALDVLTASARASAAGLGETKVVADAVTSAVNAYGIENLSAKAATDVLTAAVREGKLEADQLAPVLGRVIPLSSQLGVSFHDVGAAAAVLSKNGLSAAESITATRQILQTFLKPTDQAKKALKGVGLSTDELRKSLRERGLLDTLLMLREKFKGNTETLAELFPRMEGLNGVLTLTGGKVKDTRKTFLALEDSLGATDKAFKVASKTGENRVASALSTIQVNAVKLGKVLLPVGASILEVFANVVDAIGGLPSPVLKTVGVFAALLAAFGPLLVVIGKTIVLFAKLRAGILATSLTAAAAKGPMAALAFGIKTVGHAVRAHPLGALLTALTLLVAGLVLAWNKSETFRRIVMGVLKAIGDAGKWLWRNALKPAFDAIVKAFKTVGGAFETVWQRVIRPVIGFIVDKFGWLVQKILDGAAKAFGWIPGLGPKLRTAADKFRTFRENVNRALGNIRDKEVTVTGTLKFGGALSGLSFSEGGGANFARDLLLRREAGGILPGPPSDRDNMVIGAASGEFLVNARSTRKHRGLLEAVNADRLPGFATGGLVPHAMVPGRRDAARWAREYGRSIGNVAAEFRGALGEAVNEALTQMVSAPGVGAGVERWRGVALRALAYTGSPLSWIGSLLRRMNQESGGNPRAINLWDVNAQRGDPSRGLMQTIGATFFAYARELANRGIYDPFANIVASIRYANARYGAAPIGWNQPGGYDLGGVARGRGVLFKNTPEPERVLSPDQTQAFERLVRVLESGGGAGGPQVTVHAPQNMNPQQVGDAVAQRIAATIGGGGLGAAMP